MQLACYSLAAILSFDYFSTPRVLTFPNSSAIGTLKCFSIGIIDDTVRESNENFTVEITSITNADLGNNKTTVTIIDDDG